MNITKMAHKGYESDFEYSDDDECFIGHTTGIDDIVGFHADSVPELRAAFEEAVDDYIEFCTDLGRTPQKPLPQSLT